MGGTIIDKQSESPLIGAAFQVLNSNPILGDMTDANGNFEVLVSRERVRDFKKCLGG